MAKTSGTQVSVGIGIESAAAVGTPVAASHFIQWADLSLQGVSEKSLFKSARQLRNMYSNSMVKRKYSQGAIGIVPNVKNFPYFLSLALGSVSSGTITDSAYTHTFTVQNTNATPKAATITVENGAIQTPQYANCVCDKLSFEVSDDYAKATLDVVGMFPGTSTNTEAYTQETEFAYSNYTAKFGTTLSNASGASATPLKSFKLDINNNVLLNEAFLSGSSSITAGSLVMGRFQASGSYSLHFADTTELAKYQANTKNAMIVSFTGALIGATSLETITFKLGKLILTKQPITYNIDGLIILTQEFQVEYDATDLDVQAIVINNVNNASTHVYDTP